MTLDPIDSAGAVPKVVTLPTVSIESMMPSPSASVVASVGEVPLGGAPRNTPPWTLLPICRAEFEVSRSEGNRLALTVGSGLRVVTL